MSVNLGREPQYRIRRSVAVATCATTPALYAAVLAALFALLGDSWVEVFYGPVLGLLGAVLLVRRVRRRTLTVLDDVLVVQRDQYRLIVPWHGVTAVQRRRHQLVMNVEELVCTGAGVEAVDSRGRLSVLPDGLDQHPALTRVMVSLYAEDWRSGPIGDRLRALGTKL